MKITCEEAGHICTKAQYKEANLLEIIKLNVHLLICKTCAKFSKKNGTLTRLCNKAEIQMLKEDEKNKMKEELQKHL